MQTTVLSSKGQVIIPKALRVALRWAPGTQLEVHDTPEGLLLRPAAAKAQVDLTSGLTAIRRRIDYRGPARSLAEMEAAIMSEAAHRAGAAKPSGKASSKPTR